MSKNLILSLVVFYVTQPVLVMAQFAVSASAISSVLINSAEENQQDRLKIKFSAVSQSAADSALGLKTDDQTNFKMAINAGQTNPLGEDSASKLTLRLQSLNSDGDLMLAIPEGYVEWGTALRTTIGRKVTTFSEVDRALDMGVINPVLTVDQIRAEQQGIMGAHFQQSWNEFSMQFSAMGLYLPNQAPGVREDGGRLVAANRWASTPPEKLKFNNELKDINYKIQDIDYAKIMNHQGFVAGLGWQFQQSAVKASYGRLPLNDVVIQREIFADLEVRPQVLLSPVVTYQDVFTADFTFETGPVLTTIGLVQSNPDNQAAPGKLETQKISASTTYAIVAEYPLHQEESFIRSLSLAAAETRGGEIEDINSTGGKSDFILTPQRFKFNKPVQLKAMVSLWEGRVQKVFADIKFIYDREQQGSLLDTEINYHTALAGLVLEAGVTVVGVSEENSDDKRFLFQSQVNDRVYGGISYEF